jgi:dihydrolipoamide dehydrogenase
MSRRVVIIGGGPGGYAAALVAAQKGLSVTLVEERELGGTCLNRGCIPTKALLTCSELFSRIREAGKYGIVVEKASVDLSAMQARKDKVVKTIRAGLEALMKKRGVRVLKARAMLLGRPFVQAGEEKLEYDALIIATGTEPLLMWDGDGIVTSDGALALDAIPSSMLVVGAGAVGLEMACFYSEIGVKVTIVEMLPHILPGLDAEIADTLARELKKKGIQIKTGCKVEKIENRSVALTDCSQATYEVILQAVGRRFNTSGLGVENVGLTLDKNRIKTDERMETGVKGIYAVGDIVAGSPLLAHSAYAQGAVAALNIAGEDSSMDYGSIPNCVYSHPEAASVGMSEKEVENPLTARIPYRIMGKAHAAGEIAGLLIVVADKSSRLVKGVHIVGEKATELIHEGVVAVRLGLTVEKLAEVIRAHPTFSEIYSEAYHHLEGRALHFG